MTAVEELPRGWVLNSVVVAGSTASVTQPGVTGISHVLDTIVAGLINEGSATAFGAVIEVTNGTNILLSWALACAAGTNTTELGPLDLGFALPQGMPLVVTFNSVTPATYVEQILVKGHSN